MTPKQEALAQVFVKAAIVDFGDDAWYDETDVKGHITIDGRINLVAGIKAVLEAEAKS